jgi:TRAP-type C4-dicarboxylate transport system permease large subunit
MSWQVLRTSIMESLESTAAIFFVAVGAVMLTRFMVFSGVPEMLADLVRDYSVNLLALLLIISLIYLVLGCFLDPLGLILITLPVVLPALEPFHVNLIWFGILLVKFVEIGLMTPPVGMNVYAMKTVVGDQVSLETIFRGVAWFLVCEAIVITNLIAFPAVALTLPGLSWTPKLF